MITPILKDPRKHGGTLYTFPSASRDLTRAFSNSEYEFAFSHFACLNLPDFRYGTYNNGDIKGVYLDNLYPNGIDTFQNLNTTLKFHLQSYVMNFEIAILNGFSLDNSKYNDEILRTPSERIFFNWLQKVGAIKFSANGESLDGYGNNVDDNIEYIVLSTESELESIAAEYKSSNYTYKIGNKLYTWKGGEWKSSSYVSKTVQYIGTIDMVNNVNIDYDSFNEIYLNIPAGVGGSSDVHFDSIFDENYENGDIINLSDDKYFNFRHEKDVNCKYIIGRHPDDYSILTEQLKAIYDLVSDSDSDSTSTSYKIDTGYCINFNDSNYAGGIEGMNLISNEDFEFNCVLIYYRIRKGNGIWVTNLYGVLFLEEVTTSDYNINLNDEDERAGYIQRYPKFKDGNSWGLKLDLKIDAQPDSQMELRDKLYDDPNEGAGMQLFSEALMQLNDCAKLFYDVKKENTDIEERLYTLENMVSGIDTVYELRNDVNVLRSKVDMFQPTLNSLEGRIENIESRLTKIETNFGYLIKDIQNHFENFGISVVDKNGTNFGNVTNIIVEK